MKIPRMKKKEIEKIMNDNNVKSKLTVVVIRGYYLNSMGKKNANDFDIYDDAFFVISENIFKAFQANCDPSSNNANIAQLKTGVYEAVKHRHRGKSDAFQIVEDAVIRQGWTGDDVGRHGINFHSGGSATTGSLGCLTVPIPRWREFYECVADEMDRLNLRSFTVLLTENNKSIYEN